MSFLHQCHSIFSRQLACCKGRGLIARHEDHFEGRRIVEEPAQTPDFAGEDFPAPGFCSVVGKMMMGRRTGLSHHGHLLKRQGQHFRAWSRETGGSDLEDHPR